MKLSVNDINAQNNRMFLGENKPADIDRHTEGWIRAHQATFDDWIAQSLAAAGR
ncbi:Glycine betaine-binding periplasmic protein precursor [compost metagenome]